MLELDDKAYTLNLNNVTLPKQKKPHGNTGRMPWNTGMKWEEMYDKETRERLMRHIRNIDKYGGNRGKGFVSKWRPVVQMDEYGNRLHWYQSSAHAARKLGLQDRNIRAVCYGDRFTCGGFKWKFDERFV